MAPRLKHSFSRAKANEPDATLADLGVALETARQEGATNALFLVDLSGFHVLNNGFGRPVGDVVIQTVLKRLSQCVDNERGCAHGGGDRFLVLVSSPQSEVPLDDIAHRLIDVVREPVRVEGGGSAQLVVSATVGSVTDDGASLDELVRCADIALREAKTRGLTGHVTFRPEMLEAAQAAACVERDLREALDTERLFLTYLPGVEIASGRMTSAEALLRWQHPQRGVVVAGDFVPLLEQSGTIVDVGSWVLREACMQAAAWQRRGITVSVHVNLSPRQLGAEILVADLRETLETSHLDPSHLVLDVAENVLAMDVEAIAARLVEFRTLGVRVALDNFGTAYASLSQLKLLPLDIVEFDRSLIADVGTEEAASALMRTFVQIADGLGLETFAAGVENAVQREALVDAGCKQAFGHLYSQPVDAKDLDKLFRDFEAVAVIAEASRPSTRDEKLSRPDGAAGADRVAD
ncbi:MAG: bifunctional diguanylate cyclase/phosphodiesterase [Acidimicrobiales bacterium]|jgi:diguanylate cyclase (GGDEF)-like protein